MCNACGHPAAPGHWTDAGAATPGERLRLRFRRAELLRRVLRPYGLTAHDDGAVPGIQLATLTGAGAIVADLERLWIDAERLAGRPIDPLDVPRGGDG